MRTLIIFAGFVMLLGAGVAVAAWPQNSAAAASGFSSDELLTRAYERVHTGMPASQLGAVGFDTAKAERVSKLALMERFMPKNSADFDALDPVVQDCYLGQADCNAYIFTAMGARAVLLVEGGRVAWKDLSGVSVASRRKARTAARSMPALSAEF
jgi:hypothetical protein